MIEYEYTEGRKDCAIRVRIDGRLTGTIKPVSVDRMRGWQYFPKGQREGGEIFLTVKECQRSLEEN